MSDLFYPKGIDVIPDSYVGGKLILHEKIVLHSTESIIYIPRTSDYYGHQLWPHNTLADTEIFGWRIFNHLPLNRTSACMRNLQGGVQTNNDGCIQLEIAMKAADATDLPNEALDVLYDWMEWVCKETGIPYQFIDDFHYYPPEDGHRLGKEPWRLRGQKWDNFQGILGHQHADENVHGDPGKINVQYLKNKKIGAKIDMSTIASCTDVNDVVHQVCLGQFGNEVYYRSAPVEAIKEINWGELEGQGKSVSINATKKGVLVTIHGMNNKPWLRFRNNEGVWLPWSESVGDLPA